MADKTKIEWTQTTINPVMGCTRADESCKNCYALAMMRRYRGRNGWPVHENTVTLFPERLEKLAKMSKPKMIMLPSMGDLFHKDVPDSFLYQVFDTMRATPHIYQILTKRVGRVLPFWEEYSTHHRFFRIDDPKRDEPYRTEWPKNVWLGVSIGAGQRIADRDIPVLLSIPAAVRFVSVEPMLEAICLDEYLQQWQCSDCGEWMHASTLCDCGAEHWSDFDELPKRGIDWIVCGAESGPGRRPFNIEWARSLKNQCVDAGVPFFFKQGHQNGKVVKMPTLDGKVWDEMPNLNFFDAPKLQSSF